MHVQTSKMKILMHRNYHNMASKTNKKINKLMNPVFRIHTWVIPLSCLFPRYLSLSPPLFSEIPQLPPGILPFFRFLMFPLLSSSPSLHTFSTQPVAFFPRLQLLSASCPAEVLTRLSLSSHLVVPPLFKREMPRREKNSPPGPPLIKGSTIMHGIKS